MQSNFAILNGDTFWAFMSWARYLAFADILRERYEASLELPDDAPVEDRNFPAYTPLLSSQRSARLQKDAAFAYYHSSLMPVIEGWEELALHDEKVAALLAHDDGYYKSLRRYRNATFHYQRAFFGTKQSEWYERGHKMVLWTILLHSEFSRAFRQVVDDFPGSPEDVKAVRDLVQDIVGWLPRTSHDLTLETDLVEKYLDDQLQNSNLSDSSRQQALVLKMDVDNLSIKSQEALSNLASLREEWRSHIFEQPLSSSPLDPVTDTAIRTDKD